MPELMAILEQLLIPDRKQRPPQRRKHRQLIVWPLDRRERGAQRLDFAAVVKRPAADQQMLDAARFERAHVRPRHVLSEADEPPEQQADVPGLDRNQMLFLAWLEADGHRRRRFRGTFGHLPIAFVNQPIHERADGVGKRFLDRRVGDPLFAIRLRHWKHDHRWLLRRIGPERLERNVAGLARVDIPRHDRLERRVDRALDVRPGAEAGAQRDGLRPRRVQHLVDAAVDSDVRAPEPIDRLLRVADDEELAGNGSDLAANRLRADRLRPGAAGFRPAADRYPETRRRTDA